ncbi:MAG: response regulator transcription factor [Chitinophagaceae bacterium]|nr:response regulator transcription factor [Chitinophagaceae bacterium]
MKILVAEDEPILIRTIEVRLKKDGHELCLATDGQQAMDRMTDFVPDMVITDIMMPYASGLEIISFARQQEKRKIPIIILSSMGQEDVVLEAFKLGADDYITKPFSPNELSVRVRRLLSV